MLFKNLDKKYIQTMYNCENNKSYMIKLGGEYGCYFTIHQNAFGNCQIFVIGWFNFFSIYTELNEFVENIKFCKILGKNKNMLMIDVTEKEFIKLKDYIKASEYTIKDLIMTTKKYKSIIGSNMILVQINTSKIK